MDDFNACACLNRQDKWYLGAGDRLTWTPPHPQWTDVPGFWDEAHYYDLQLSPVFTVTLLTANGEEIPLQVTGRDWRPDRLRQTYNVPEMSLAVTERRTAHANDVLASTFSLDNTGESKCSVRLVVWTRQPSMMADTPGPLTGLSAAEEQLQFTRPLQTDDRPKHDVQCALKMDVPVSDHSVVASESGPDQPHWEYTPFYETVGRENLGPPITSSSPKAPVVYLGLQADLTIAPRSTETASAAFSAAPDATQTVAQVSDILEDGPPPRRSEALWKDYFGSLPSFECSDPYLERYYWHRWYGLRLFTRRQPEGNYQYPAIYEGPEYFRKHVSYSAQCHMLETRWQATPEVAQGSLLNFLENQRPNGGFFGHVYPHDADEESFYHANWSHVWEVHRTHPDTDFLHRAYDGLSEYVDYFDSRRDPDGSGLYDIWNHYETGQEYMHRYQAVSEEADEVHWGRIFRLKGVDAAVQLYQTKKVLAKMADALGRPDETKQWSDRAELTKTAVLEHMWDPATELFFDVDPEAGERTGVKAAVCFYPYFTDIVGERHLSGLKQHLFDPDEFWTEYPVPASSVDDPYFSDVPHWKEQRKNCPWNGRVWPMTNSHIAEAICQAALQFDDNELRHRGATFIRRFIHMMFDADDPRRPNCFEHYNPSTGQPCRYRGIDDYQHSWVVDLLIKYVAGIRPGDHTVTVDPFPVDMENLAVDGVPVRGHDIGVTRDKDRFTVRVDGDPVDKKPLGSPITLSL